MAILTCCAPAIVRMCYRSTSSLTLDSGRGRLNISLYLLLWTLHEGAVRLWRNIHKKVSLQPRACTHYCTMSIILYVPTCALSPELYPSLSPRFVYAQNLKDFNIPPGTPLISRGYLQRKVTYACDAQSLCTLVHQLDPWVLAHSPSLSAFACSEWVETESED